MAESRPGLSTLGEDEERSAIDMVSATNIQDDQQEQQEDIETLDELEDIAPSVKTDANKFRMLCDNVQTSYWDIDNAMLELLELKDSLLLQFLPPNVATRITVVVSRLHRAYSLSQVPINELVRLVQLYSQPFDMKSIALRKLYENNEMKKRMLNIALQKMTSMENSIKRHVQLKCINNWEKMYICLALPRSNVRKWKFRLKTFRETSQLGYEHVIEWLNANTLRPVTGTDVGSNEPIDEEDALGDVDHAETSGDVISMPENEEQQRMEQGSDFADEIESDNEGSFLSSAGKQRAKAAAEAAETKETKQTHQSVAVAKADAEVQVQPDVDDQQTSTGDMLATKSLILRVYRPIGLFKAKFQCVVQAQQRKYTTTVFTFEKQSTPKDDNAKTKGRLTASRVSRPTDSRTKKRGTDSSTPEDVDINTIDKQQCDELLIPMPSVLKRRSLFQSDIDPDAVQIDLLGEDKLCGSIVLSPEDLRLLDLPNLHSPTSAPLVTIDDNTKSSSRPASHQSEQDYDQQSSELYKLWVSRTPPTFAVYNEKRETVAKLPLHMFWYHKVEITHATKCTMTAPMEIRPPSPKVVYVPQSTLPVETHDQALSPLAQSPRLVVHEGTEPALSRLTLVDDQIEAIKTGYEDKINKLHENYQAEIRRLTKLLNEAPSRRSSQMAELSELDETMRNTAEEDPSVMDTHRQVRQQPKRDILIENQPPPLYGKNLPKNFLDRYQMFLERSAAHRNQLVSKVEQEAARNAERQMEIQHRLHRPEQTDERYDDLCLPAVFMPFRSGNVFNPRAYRFFHHIGTTDPRLTQTPSIFKLPPLPSGSVSVLNLFELSRCYEAANGRERSMDKTASQSSQPAQPPAPPTTQTSN